MKATIINLVGARYGVPLREMEFGSVVRRGESETAYLVASPMDCTGDRLLVTLGGGTVKRPPQETPVFPIRATFYLESLP